MRVSIELSTVTESQNIFNHVADRWSSEIDRRLTHSMEIFTKDPEVINEVFEDLQEAGYGVELVEKL